MNNKYKHFTVIVAGDNPEELMKEYDYNKKIEPLILYKLKDASNLKKECLKLYEKLYTKLNNNLILKEKINSIKNMSPQEYFYELTENLEHDKNGDAFTTKNPSGKWKSYQLAKHLGIPFKIKNSDKEVFQAYKKDIDWDLMHLYNTNLYEITWDMVLNNKKPSNEEEEMIYNNMKERKLYFQSFQNKNNYVIINTSFWSYAFLSENTGWIEMNENISQFEWIKNYYNNFIIPLLDNTKLTIYECVI